MISRKWNNIRVISRRLSGWFIEMWPLWTTIIVPLIVYAVSHLGTTGIEEQLRTTGLLLQFAGITVVALGMRDRRIRYDRNGPVHTFVDWIKRLPEALRLGSRVSGAEVRIAARPPEIRASATLRPDPTATIEERVDRLHGLIEGLTTQVVAVEQQIVSEREATHRQLAEERDAHEQTLDGLRGQVRELAVGGLHWERMGLIWLVLGLFQSSAPQEMLEMIPGVNV